LVDRTAFIAGKRAAHKPRRPNALMMPPLPNAAGFMRWLGRDSGFAIQQPRE
jgi:hypothetical protein